MGARGDRRRAGRARLLLPQPVPLRLERPRGDARRARPAHARRAAASLFHRWRQWDWIAAQRVDRYVANSDTTRRRIKRYFGRDATVLHPPVDLGRFTPGRPVGDHYLVRLRADAAQAHRRRGRGLQPPAAAARGRGRRPGRPPPAADGRPDRPLRRPRPATSASPSCSRARRALVVTATEEFGIAAVEAQAAGRPVIALAEGGARETVQDGETGAFYSPRRPGRARLGGARLRRRWPWTPRPASPTRRASTTSASATVCRAWWTRPSRPPPRRTARAAAQRRAPAPAARSQRAPGSRNDGHREGRPALSSHARRGTRNPSYRRTSRLTW